MSRQIRISQEQSKRLGLMERKAVQTPSRRTIIIKESQIPLLTETGDGKVMHYEFESKVRKYMKELYDNPCSPSYDKFFTDHNIPENILQNKMLDLGIISKKDNITEPEDADGKKHSVHSRKFIFSGKDFDDKMDKLYNTFFNKGERILKEADCAGVGGSAGGFSADSVSAGATNAAGVGEWGSGQYTVPFGKVQRRKMSGQDDNEDITRQQSNIDMGPALERKPGKVAVNRK